MLCVLTTQFFLRKIVPFAFAAPQTKEQPSDFVGKRKRRKSRWRSIFPSPLFFFLNTDLKIFFNTSNLKERSDHAKRSVVLVFVFGFSFNLGVFIRFKKENGGKPRPV
jgi:hypothetical protein